MKGVYRVAIRRGRRGRMGWVLLAAGMLCVYGSSFFWKGGAMTVRPSAGVVMTREETLEERSFFLVSVYDSASAECCRAESARFASRGAAGAVVYTGGVYHAMGAVFDDIDSARASAQSLCEGEQIAAQPVVLCAPETILRVTATKQQLAALLQANETLLQAAEAFGGLAALIDAGEIDMQGAQGRLNAQEKRLKSAYEELQERVEGENEPVSARLLEMIVWTQAESRRLAALPSPARLALSSGVRGLQIGLIERYCQWRSALAR